MKNTILVLVLTIAALTVPAFVFAGTSWGFAGNSNGGFAISVNHSHYNGCGHYNQRVVTRTTVVRGGGHYYGGHRPVHYPVYREQYRGHRGVVHRQQGRTYYQGSHGRRVIVVPSGRSHRGHGGGYRY